MGCLLVGRGSRCRWPQLVQMSLVLMESLWRALVLLGVGPVRDVAAMAYYVGAGTAELVQMSLAGADRVFGQTRE